MNRTERPCSDPIAEFRTFPCNTRWYAEHWLRRGDAHPQEHWVIRDRLDPWRRRVAAEASLREALLAEIRPEPLPMRATPSPALTMPTGAAQSLAGEQKGLPRYPSTLQICECAEVIETTGKSQFSQKRPTQRAYHRRAKPRGTGRWAAKCRRRNVA
jgi:hypothetical protein